MPNLSQQGNRLQPPEAFFDAFPLSLTDGISSVTRGANVNRAPTGALEVLGQVRRDLEVPALGHEIRRVVTLVASHGHLLRARNLLQHHQCRVAFRRSVGLEYFGVHNQTVAILYQKIPVVTQLGFFALAFARQLGIGIGGGLVGVVLDRLSPWKSTVALPGSSGGAMGWP